VDLIPAWLPTRSNSLGLLGLVLSLFAEKTSLSNQNDTHRATKRHAHLLGWPARLLSSQGGEYRRDISLQRAHLHHTPIRNPLPYRPPGLTYRDDGKPCRQPRINHEVALTLASPSFQQSFILLHTKRKCKRNFSRRGCGAGAKAVAPLHGLRPKHCCLLLEGLR
jgi:hypothetical protein